MTSPTDDEVPPLGVDDVKALLLDLYVAQRDNARLRAANRILAAQLAAAAAPAGGDPDSSSGEDVP